MLIVLTLLFTSLIILPYLAYKYDRESLIGWIIVPNVLVAIALLITWSVSYSNYVDMKKHTANFDTYADTVASYEKFAVLDTKAGPITDLKYQNYQKSIKDLIEDLRNSCIIYNRRLAGKRTYGNNIIFSWLIVMPDDNMKIVKFSDFLDVRDRGTI